MVLALVHVEIHPCPEGTNATEPETNNSSTVFCSYFHVNILYFY